MYVTQMFVLYRVSLIWFKAIYAVLFQLSNYVMVIL
jgi:hypothetical protein